MWVNDQILFQVGPIEHMLKHGLVSNSHEDMVLMHFFNKNKTHTLGAWNFFKVNFETLGFIYFEEPKGVHLYIRNIGNAPVKIEKEIIANIKHYAEIDNSAIQIEYKEY